MIGQKFSTTTMSGGAVFLLACIAFVIMFTAGMHRDTLALPATVGWVAALVALRPLVAREMHNQLYFAFGVMAFLIFFVHETYEYTGKVRAFPLIIGYTGVILSALDLLSLTDTGLGRAITRIFGCALEPDSDADKRTVKREILVCLAMGASVLAIWLFGFLITAPLFVAAWMMIAGRKPLKHALYGGIATLVFVYGLFELLLEYELYRGIVVMWLTDMWQG